MDTPLCNHGNSKVYIAYMNSAENYGLKSVISKQVVIKNVLFFHHFYSNIV